MPRAYLMSWEGEPYFRWVKMYKGTRYRVGCHELPIPRSAWTKEASAPAANQWWEAKLTSLQAARHVLEAHDYPDVPVLRGRADYHREHGEHDQAEVVEAEIVSIKSLPPADVPVLDADTAARVEGFAKLTGLDLSTVDPVVLQAAFSRVDPVWADRVKRTQTTPPERTIGGLADMWLKDRQDEARAGVRSNENADALRRHLYKFRDFIGTSNPVETITVDSWHRWYVFCAGKVAKRDTDANEGWSPDTASKVFTVARQFVKWLWERDILATLPKNLSDRKHKFERPGKDIPTFTNPEIKQLLGAARGVHRLLLLLPLNCGMTQKDVADLRKDEIDLTSGRITRRRSKMAKKRVGRVVSYKLWPQVVELLREHLNADPAEPRALTTKSGQPWVWTQTTDAGKLRKSDNIATVFNTLKRKVGMNPAGKGERRAEGKSFRVFRKTSATRLKANPTHRDLRYFFLGHSEKTVADRHYAAASQDQLDAAVGWLRTQYDL